MNKQQRTIFILLLAVISLLFVISFMFTLKLAEAHKTDYRALYDELNKQSVKVDKVTDSIEAINNRIETIEKVQPKDGKDGKNGVNGMDGKDSKSTNTITTIVKEKTVKGDRGEKGDDAPVLEVRLNPVTKSLEKKYDNQTFWSELIPCERLLVGCL